MKIQKKFQNKPFSVVKNNLFLFVLKKILRICLIWGFSWEPREKCENRSEVLDDDAYIRLRSDVVVVKRLNEVGDFGTQIWIDAKEHP